MSHLSNLFGPIEPPPEHVNFRGYVLCRPCSRAMHQDHTNPCHCDICEVPDVA